MMYFSIAFVTLALVAFTRALPLEFGDPVYWYFLCHETDDSFQPMGSVLQRIRQYALNLTVWDLIIGKVNLSIATLRVMKLTPFYQLSENAE
jgi:hypothetical protein